MKAVRINKNFYEFFEPKEIGGYTIDQSIGFDSYTNTLQYKEEMEKKLFNINERLNAMELLGMTNDDLQIEEGV